MINSLRILFSAPYNRKNPVFAVKRFIIWKIIRAARLKNVKIKFWDDRIIFINYDSSQSMWLMYNYIVDWEEFNLIQNYIKSHDHIADIGANMGFYSIWMSKFISGTGRIHSFEPDQNNFKRLNENVKLNKLDDVVKTSQIAVSEVNGQLSFTIGLDGENHIVTDNKAQVVQIKSVTLDTYAKNNQITMFSYVKLDVEGFEKNVLQGASELLSLRRIDIIQLEINKSLYNSGTTINELLVELKKYNYQLCSYEIVSNSVTPINYSIERENYFAVKDIGLINKRLQEK
jgi:FkbM family methyltransferase